MLYTERNRLANALLADAAFEGRQLMVVGSGVWFQALERALQRVHKRHYAMHAMSVNFSELFNFTYESGGSVQCVNLGTGANMELLERDENPPPQTIYLVEDANGVHASMWRARVRPYLRGATCRIVYLGDTDDESS